MHAPLYKNTELCHWLRITCGMIAVVSSVLGNNKCPLALQMKLSSHHGGVLVVDWIL